MTWEDEKREDEKTEEEKREEEREGESGKETAKGRIQRD